MKERRSLVDGLKTDPEIKQFEEAFVYGTSHKPEPSEQSAAPNTTQPNDSSTSIPHNTLPAAPSNASEHPKILPQMTGRIPVTTRCRPELASALKRASLQRQLAGAQPYYVQDIMEDALENWLRNNGYI